MQYIGQMVVGVPSVTDYSTEILVYFLPRPDGTKMPRKFKRDENMSKAPL